LVKSFVLIYVLSTENPEFNSLNSAGKNSKNSHRIILKNILNRIFCLYVKISAIIMPN